MLCPIPTHSNLVDIGWKRLAYGFLKCNTDVAFFDVDKLIRFDMVLHGGVGNSLLPGLVILLCSL